MPAKGNVLKPCGTRAAYLRHLGRREVPDEACRQANTQFQAEQRKRNARKRRLGELRQQLLLHQLIGILHQALREAS